MNVSLITWLVVIAAILILIFVDLVTVSRKPHDVMFKEAAGWSIFYIALAIGFGFWVWQSAGSQFGTEYFAAYLVEKSLSVDNLFVFIIILTQFKVPSIYHQRVLMIGVLLALVLRAIFIAVGAAALAAFSFTFVIFGAILIWTGFGLFKHWDEDPTPEDNFMVKAISKRMTITDKFDGSKAFTKIDGKKVATPMFLVFIAIASTDLLFALDSIPATFGVTSEPMFIGIKLIFTYLHETWSEVPKIPTLFSLSVIGLILIISTIASLIKSKKDPNAHAHAGRVTGSKKSFEQKESK